MNFCIAGYLRIKSWPNNAMWFIKSISLKQGGGGGGGKRRGLGPRNDVLTTCKAITLRDGQRIIAAFSHSKYF